MTETILPFLMTRQNLIQNNSIFYMYTINIDIYIYMYIYRVQLENTIIYIYIQCYKILKICTSFSKSLYRA